MDTKEEMKQLLDLIADSDPYELAREVKKLRDLVKMHGRRLFTTHDKGEANDTKEEKHD